MLNRIETSKENETEEKRTLTHLSCRYVKRRSPLAKIDEVYIQYSDFHVLFLRKRFIAGQKRKKNASNTSRKSTNRYSRKKQFTDKNVKKRNEQQTIC